MIYGISAPELSFVLEEISKNGMATTSQIRQFAIQALADAIHKCNFETIVEDLAEDGWIEDAKFTTGQNVNRSFAHALDSEVNSLWELTDTARKRFNIKVVKQDKITPAKAKDLYKTIQTRAKQKLRKEQEVFRQDLLEAIS